MDYETRMFYYSGLIKNNSNALKNLDDLNIDPAITNHEEYNLITNAFVGLMTEIRAMAKNCAKIVPTINLEEMMNVIEAVEVDSFEAINTARISCQLQYIDSEEVLVETNRTLFDTVLELSEPLKDPSNPEFKVENIQTPHDVIRYLHQMGVKGLYSLDYLNNHSLTNYVRINDIGKDSDRMTIMDVDNQLGGKGKSGEKVSYKTIKNPLLTSIINLYNSPEFKQKKSSETFKGILIGNKLITQMELGCHYAELEVDVNGQENNIYFHFRDTTSYSYSKQRSVYVRTVLEKLGFEMKIENNETRATWKNGSDEQAYEQLNKILKLTASTKDLDVCSEFGDYPKKAVNLFMAGKVNIYEELREAKGRGEKDDVSIK